MAKKDPCVLVYFDKWISSTNGMNADFRSWYFDLLIYQYDKKGIPNDLDFIAGICRVRPSEYDRFKQMLKQVLEQKFTKCEDGMLRNETMQEVLEKRETFKSKRELSGTIGQVIKVAKSIKGFKDKYLDRLKNELFELDLESIRKHMDKQVLEQTLKLYIDVIVDEDVNKDLNNIQDEKILKQLFSNFRNGFPGRKNGLDVEFKNFKRHQDWKDCVPSLMPSLESEIEWRVKKLETGFVPQWKNLSTWINQRCWEQELEEIKIIRTKQHEAQNSGVAERSKIIAEQRRQELGIKS